MDRTRVSLILAGAACAVFIVCVWVYNQPKFGPRFEIVDFIVRSDMAGLTAPLGVETDPIGWTYQIVFSIKNNGTGEATGVFGSIELGGVDETEFWITNKDWEVPSSHVLRPGETYKRIVVTITPKLGINAQKLGSVTIRVGCNEGVTQKFTESPSS
jgi:hypothetical protein